MPAYLEEGTGDKAIGGGSSQRRMLSSDLSLGMSLSLGGMCVKHEYRLHDGPGDGSSNWGCWGLYLSPLSDSPTTPPQPLTNFSLSLVLSEKRDMGQGLRCIRQTASILGMKRMKSCRIAKQS